VWPVLWHSARTAMAAVASLLVARLFGLPATYWAPITTLVINAVIAGGPRLKVSWQRFVGTALGAFVGGLVASHFAPRVFVFGACVFLLGLLCAVARSDRERISFRGRCADDCAFWCRERTRHGKFAFHRCAEVSIGVGVALIFAWVWPEREVASAVSSELFEFLAETERFAFSGNRRRIAILRSWQSSSSPRRFLLQSLQHGGYDQRKPTVASTKNFAKLPAFRWRHKFPPRNRPRCKDSQKGRPS